jgi:hypothetical protein
MADLYVHIPGVSVFLLQEDEPAPVVQGIDDMLEGVQSDGFSMSASVTESLKFAVAWIIVPMLLKIRPREQQIVVILFLLFQPGGQQTFRFYMWM